MADLLHHRCDVGVGRGLAREKARLVPLGGAIQIDALKEDRMKMEMHIDGAAKTLHKRDRSRLHFVPLSAACDRLVHLILRDGGTDDRMDGRGQVL